ncbi:MAG: hypothetical protein ACLQPD_00090 [Desulfomonilaceae bacterium]
MGRFWAAVLGIGLCVSFALGEASTHAWELLDLNASFLWKYEWCNQRGHQGFFGPYNVDNGPGTTTNLNFWNGAQFDTNISTSADAGWSYFAVEFNPKFQVNPAIRITAKYRLSTYGVPLNTNYHTQDARGVNTAFSDGQWTMFWITAGSGNFPNPVDGNIQFNFNRYTTSPNIPDRGLGYEIDMGFDWRILDRCQIGMVLGCRQPGKWFNYACIDRSVPAWHTGNVGDLFGTRPDRPLNAVVGGEFSSKFEF